MRGSLPQPESRELRVIKSQVRRLWFFATIVLADAYPDKFHDWGRIQMRMCDFLEDPESTQKFMSAFRLSFKTTVLLAYMVWDFCWSYEDGKPSSLVYVTATKDNSHLISDEFRHILLNCQILHDIFPWLPKDKSGFKKFTKDATELGHVKTHFSSYETTLVSRHYPKWINDDLENDENSGTDSGRAAVIQKWRLQKAILFRIKKRKLGLEIESGTPYHVQGLNWKIRNMKSYAKLIIPSEIDGKPTFPELYEMEDLQKKREEMGTTLYSAQFLLQPLAEEDALCKEEWLREWAKLPEVRWRAFIIDPGGSEPHSNDPTAFSICDHGEDGKIYSVYSSEIWLGSMELLEKIVKLMQEYDPDETRIEKEKYGTTIADLKKHLFPKLNISFVEHKKRKKEHRIWKLRQWFQERSFLIGPDQQPLRDQILSYPTTTSGRDDLLDALAYQLDIHRVPRAAKPFRLPSGRIFEPQVPQDFEEELDKYMNRRYMSERERVRDNDSRF